MKTLITATHHSTDLSKITPGGASALLPIAGKTLIDYSIDSLFQAGIREATIIGKRNLNDLSAQVGDGSRWGMNLSYSMMGDDSIIKDLGENSFQETLIVNGDSFWHLDISDFLNQARQSQAEQVIAVASNKPIAKWFSGAKEPKPTLCGLDEISSSLILPEIDASFIHKVDSCLGFYKLCIDLAGGALLPYQVAGRPIGKNIYVDVGGRITNSSIRGMNSGYIGCNSYVHKSAVLRGNVFVGSDVVLAQNAVLENSVVLSNTYVGEMMNIKNSIVCGSTYLSMLDGSFTSIDDSLMVAAI